LLPRVCGRDDNARVELDGSIGFDAGLADIPDLAARAERLGFAALWTAETRHDPFLPLALIAERTEQMRFGTAIAVAFARSPTAVAHTAWDLAQRSGGRFILGLGTQVRAHVERRFAMSWSGRPVAQLRDYVAALRAVWHGWQTGEPVRHRGPYYQVTLMTPFFSPGPIAHPEIPVYLAGVGAAMCGLAGEVGDGLIVHPMHSAQYLAEVVRPAVASGAERTGRDPGRVALSGSALVGFGDAGREAVREQIAFYASTPTYRPVLDLHGWADVGASLSELARRGRWSEMAGLVPDPMVDAFALVVDGWEDVAPALRARYNGLLDRVSLYRPLGDPADDDGWRTLLSGLRQE
jgi:probable F420-dependent oxidoreductase